MELIHPLHALYLTGSSTTSL